MANGLPEIDKLKKKPLPDVNALKKKRTNSTTSRRGYYRRFIDCCRAFAREWRKS